MITGDQVLIAKEMSRILGLGMNISDATGLPSLDEDGKVRPLCVLCLPCCMLGPLCCLPG